MYANPMILALCTSNLLPIHMRQAIFLVFSQLTAIFLWAKIVRVSLFVEHEFNYISGFNNHD